MPYEFHHEGYLVSDDPARLDVDAIHAFLVRSHWGIGIPREVVARSVANSLCLGIYAAAGEQVGLVRVISDYATFAYVCDVYVLEPHRGRGLSKARCACTPRIRNSRTSAGIIWSPRTSTGFTRSSVFLSSRNPSATWKSAMSVFTSASPRTRRRNWGFPVQSSPRAILAARA